MNRASELPVGTHWATTSASYESQKPPIVHRGFGERSSPLALIEIYWPGERSPQTLTDVELNQKLEVVRSP